MSVAASQNTQEITSKTDLVAYLEGGCKPREDWRIGTEHEKFVFTRDDRKPLTYDGPRGVREILTRMERFGWQPIMEGDNVIALRQAGRGTVSLEPAGQIELSGAPLQTLHETCREVQCHRDQLSSVLDELDIGMLGLGFAPTWQREDMNWMPKGRYGIMRRYMPEKGNLGLDMMLRTCTVQVNLDFESEADMAAKLRIAFALQPIATALWANSPITEGRPNGYLSYRSAIWQDTDPDRTGILPFVFDGTMSFERWVDYMLDVPMYFVYRGGKYIDVAGQSFRDFMDGRLPGLPGERPTIGDWEDHLSTAFPEVRLKRFIEMRGADSGPWDRICALPAFWVGLIYDAAAQDEALALVSDWTPAEVATLLSDIRKTGLKARIGGRSVQEVATDVLAIAEGGLKRRARLDAQGQDETHFLDPLKQIARSGITPAEALLSAFHGRWQGNISALFDDEAGWT